MVALVGEADGSDGTDESLGLRCADCRKTSLLKCMAELNVYQAGEILLHGK